MVLYLKESEDNGEAKDFGEFKLSQIFQYELRILIGHL